MYWKRQLVAYLCLNADYRDPGCSIDCKSLLGRLYRKYRTLEWRGTWEFVTCPFDKPAGLTHSNSLDSQIDLANLDVVVARGGSSDRFYTVPLDCLMQRFITLPSPSLSRAIKIPSWSSGHPHTPTSPLLFPNVSLYFSISRWLKFLFEAHHTVLVLPLASHVLDWSSSKTRESSIGNSPALTLAYDA